MHNPLPPQNSHEDEMAVDIQTNGFLNLQDVYEVFKEDTADFGNPSETWIRYKNQPFFNKTQFLKGDSSIIYSEPRAHFYNAIKLGNNVYVVDTQKGKPIKQKEGGKVTSYPSLQETEFGLLKNQLPGKDVIFVPAIHSNGLNNCAMHAYVNKLLGFYLQNKIASLGMQNINFTEEDIRTMFGNNGNAINNFTDKTFRKHLPNYANMSEKERQDLIFAPFSKMMQECKNNVDNGLASVLFQKVINEVGYDSLNDVPEEVKREIIRYFQDFYTSKKPASYADLLAKCKQAKSKHDLPEHLNITKYFPKGNALPFDATYFLDNLSVENAQRAMQARDAAKQQAMVNGSYNKADVDKFFFAVPLTLNERANLFASVNGDAKQYAYILNFINENKNDGSEEFEVDLQGIFPELNLTEEERKILLAGCNNNVCEYAKCLSYIQDKNPEEREEYLGRMLSMAEIAKTYDIGITPLQLANQYDFMFHKDEYKEENARELIMEMFANNLENNIKDNNRLSQSYSACLEQPTQNLSPEIYYTMDVLNMKPLQPKQPLFEIKADKTAGGQKSNSQELTDKVEILGH